MVAALRRKAIMTTMIYTPTDFGEAVVAGLIVSLLSAIACFLYKINDHLYHIRWCGRDERLGAAASVAPPIRQP
jgi:hypothetical protein